MAEQPTMREALTRALQEIERLRTQSAKRSSEPIAIVSMACRFPGGVDGPEALWSLLEGGLDAITEVPKERWDAGAHFDPNPDATGKTYSRWGGFLGPVDTFDAAFFGISPKEAKSIDPQERLLLETTWEALERAGIVPEKLSGSATGVYVGICGTEYLTLGGLDPSTLDAYSFLGTAHSAIVGRLSYVLGLEGPNFPVDTACSSSLVALHLACQGLRAGECDLALAGGVNLLLSPLGHVYLSRLKAMSPTGRCHTFSEDADGYVRAEGCGMVLLKRLTDAERDGDRILALIRGSAVNQDGQSNGFTAPSGAAQKAVIRRALEVAKVSGSTIDYVECHGTGTPLGDPIEVQALAGVLGEGRSADAPVIIGSIKSNLGHTEGAAGIAGVIKTVLALEHQRLPRTLHAERLNPHIAWDELPVRVARAPTPWTHLGHPRRAGVSSFGFSGTNAHVILEEAPQEPDAAQAEAARAEAASQGPLLLSAREGEGLRLQARRWATWLETHPDAVFTDVVATAARRRSAFAFRAAISAFGASEAREALWALAEDRPHPELSVGSGRVPGKLAALFTGQGAQRPGMGRGLYRAEPVFARRLDELNRAFSAYLPRPLLEVMFEEGTDPSTSSLHETAWAQPALFALELSLFRLLESWGIRPACLLGHSIGELTAATAAGVLSLEDAAKLVAGRGRLMQAARRDGAMLSLEVGIEELRTVLSAFEGRVELAAHNGPGQLVVSGDTEAVLSLAEGWKKEGRRARRLQVSHAFHSAHMDAAAAELLRLAEGCRFSAPQIPIASNVTGTWLSDQEATSPEYWARQLREPVRFFEGIRALEAQGVTTYLECGPSPVLSALARGCVSQEAATFIPTLKELQDEAAAIRETQRAVWVAGHDAHLGTPSPKTSALVPLPTYAFVRRRHWIEAPMASLGGARASDRFALAGSRLHLPDGGLLHLLEVGPGSQAYLRDHLVYGHIVVPGAFFAAVLLSVGHTVYPGAPVAVEGFQLHQALTFQDEFSKTPLFVQLIPEGSSYRVSLTTRRGGAFVEHASGHLREAAPLDLAVADDLDNLRRDLPELQDATPVLEGLGQRNIDLRPGWRRLLAFAASGNQALGALNELDHGDAPVDGSALDALFGLLSATFDSAEREAVGSADDVPYLPFSVERLLWSGAPGKARWVAQARAPGTSLLDPQLKSDARLWGDAGELLCRVEGFVAVRAPMERLKQAMDGGAEDLERRRYQLSWVAPEGAKKEAFGGVTALLQIGGPSHLGAEVHAALSEHGGNVEILADLAEATLDRVSRVVVVWPKDTKDGGAEAVHHLAQLGLDQLQRWPAGTGRSLIWLVPEGLSGSPLWGLSRTARMERPDLQLKVVEVRGERPLASALLSALRAAEETECAVSEKGWEVLRLLRTRSRPSAGEALKRVGEGPVWITGGTGGLGAQVARWLAASHGVRRLVLSSRAGGEGPRAQALAQELEGLGVEVLLEACDAAEESAVKAVLQKIEARWPFSRLRGVVHAAGVLDDGILEGVTKDRLSAVLRPKVDGALHLDRLTQDLELFVLFSSVAGALGTPGQGSYAAANTFLDALAQKRRREGKAALSILFGPWASHGMAADAKEQDRRRRERQGIDALTSEEGLKLLELALGEKEEALSVAVALDPRRLERALDQSAAPVPSVLRRLVQSSVGRAEKKSALLGRLLELPKGQRERALLEAVQKEIAEVLGLSSGREVKAKVALSELGLDSLMAVDLRNRLAALSGVSLPTTVIFDYPSPDAVTGLLLKEMGLLEEEGRVRKPRAAITAGTNEPIAVVSMACRFPGGAASPEAFFELLDAGTDAITEVPKERWDLKAYFDADPDALGKTYSRWGGFVGDIERFDPSFFGISPKEARSIDPQQRLLLETTWEAFERAGYTEDSLRNSDTGVYVGICGTEYQVRAMADVEGIDAYSLIGTAHSGIVGRLSYWLGLRGPNFPVDTACSSSLVALHLACQALRDGECEMALVAGVNLLLSPHSYVYFSRLKAMSPTGRSRAFSADADGYVRAEGCGVLVLKRLAEAQRDGDHIWALIRGTAVGQDGPSNGFTAPNGPAQQAVIRRALDVGGCAPSSIGYVECHGTGTPLGDPIEVQALAAVLGEGRPKTRPVHIGSVKTNIGHAEGAAGIASVIKTVMALKRRRLPKTLHAVQLSPHIPWDELPVSVVTESMDWQAEGGPRRAGVSSFGFSGTNAHVVLEEPPKGVEVPGPSDAQGPLPLVISARTNAALLEQARRFGNWLMANPEVGWAEVVETAALCRTHFEARAGVVAATSEEAASRLLELADGQGRQGMARGSSRGKEKLAFLFSGQGSQWAGMGRELYQESPIFRSALDEITTELDLHLAAPLKDVLFSTEDELLLGETAWTQPGLFALEVALYRYWDALGIQPDILLGHSIGELAAAHVAGVLSLDDAARLVCARGRLMQSCTKEGAMLAIEAPEAEIQAFLAHRGARASIAAVNGSRQTVLSGDRATLEEAALAFAAQGRRVQRLKVSHAFHSPHMDPILDDFRRVAESCTYRVPQVPIASNLTGRLATDSELTSPEYWVRQLRGTVRFAEGMRALEEQGVSTYLECGPGGALAALGAHCLSKVEEAAFLRSLKREGEVQSAMQTALELFVRGYPLAWSALFGGRARRRGQLLLPTYPFQRERHYVDASALAHLGFGLVAAGAQKGPYALAGRRLALPGDDAHYVLLVGAEHQPYLAEHEILGLTIVPAAFYLSTVLSVAVEHFAGAPVTLEEITFLRPLVLSGTVRMHVVLTPEGEGARFSVRTQSAEGEEWLTHVEGALRPGTPRASPLPALEDFAKACLIPVQASEAAALLEARQAKLGAQFLWIVSATRGEGAALLELEPPAALTPAGAPLHPCLIDQGFAGGFTLAFGGQDPAPRLPFSIRALRFADTGLLPVKCGVMLRDEQGSDGETAIADIVYWDSAGEVVLTIEGYVNRRVADVKVLAPGKGRVAAARFELVFEAVERPRAAPTIGPRVGLFCSDPTSSPAEDLRAGLEAAGAQVLTLAEPPWTGADVDWVISLWAAGEDPVAGAHHLAGQALEVLKSAIAVQGKRPLKWVWLTQGAVATRDGEWVSDLGASTLWGLARTARQEQPDLDLALVDLGAPAAEPRTLWEDLLAALGSQEPELALRGGELLAPRLVRRDHDEGAPALERQGEGTIWITGGLGAVGLEIARWLVTELGVRHLLLSARRGLLAPGAKEAVLALEALGARVTVAALDVADRAQLQSALDAIPAAHPLAGVIHAAGVLDDGVLTQLSPERVSAVLKSKVDGAFWLHQLTQGLPLQSFVLISSVAGVMGAPGQGNYAAANQFLDALAQHRRALGLPALSIAFGPWADRGITQAISPQERVRMERRGVDLLDPKDALQLLDIALKERVTGMVAVSLKEKRIEAALERSGGDVPTVFRRLIQPRAKVSPAALGLQKTLAPLPEAARLETLLEVVQAEIRQVMGLGAKSEVHRAQPLQEAGLDSLMAVELRNRLSGLTGAKLPLTLVFDHPSPEAMARFLLGKLKLTAEPEVLPPPRQRRVSREEPIAVVSMACRFPGGVDTPEALWRLLDEGRDTVSDVPAERWEIDGLFDPDPEARGKTYSRWGSFLGDVEGFDPAFFGISAAEASSIDPQQRLLLETGWEAFERAGYTQERLNGSSTGVYVGICGMEYLADALSDYDAVDAYSYLGVAHSAVVGRLSYWLGLQGPNFPVDTACSSSLVTVHLACQALRNEECDLALAGGVNLILAPWGHIYFSRLKALSPTGRCRTFAATADGYVRSEGCGMILLKRQSDAERDGDTVLALIRGSAINQDGRSNGFTAPSGPAQVAVIRQALKVGGVPPESVEAVECHGTGTPLGDPIEVQALASVYGTERPVTIGSLKSNIGHAEGAAGIGGALKAILTLQHGRHPKLLHFEAPSPHIPWADLNVRVAAESTPWPRGAAPRRMGVSSFGFSGTNAHVIFEEPKAASISPAPALAPALPPLLLSGQSQGALRALAERWASWLVAHPETNWLDLVHTAAVERTHFDVRAAIHVADPQGAVEALKALAEGRPHAHLARGQRRERGKLAFVFPGQGSQWPKMGAELLRASAAFREAVDRADAALRPFLEVSVRAALEGGPGAPSLERVEVVQPALFAMAIGLAAAWQELGIRPGAVVGHSQGEIAAAVVSQALSLSDGARIVATRSHLLSKLSERGAMAVIGRSAQEVSQRIEPYMGAVSVAVVNTQSSTVVAGDAAKVDQLITTLEAEGIYAKRVKVDYASHSAHVDSVIAELRGLLETIQPQEPVLPFYSTVTGARLKGRTLGAEYWCRNLRETVRFDRALEQLHRDGFGTFVEVSAHPVLGMALTEAGGERSVVSGTLARDAGDQGQLYRSLASLHLDGVQVDWPQVLGSLGGRRVPLPTYPFQRKRYWRQAARPETHKGLYAEAWASLGTTGQRDATGRWVVLTGGQGRSLAARLTSVLAQRGGEVTTLDATAGAASPFDALPPGELRGMISLLSLEDEHGGGFAGLKACLTLVQALGKQSGPLWLLTQGAVCAVDEDRVPEPLQAATWGLGRIAALEHPDCFAGLIDLPEAPTAADLERLGDVLLLGKGEGQVALRKGERLVRRLVTAAKPSGSLAPVRGTALVTGGTGGLGSHLARWLVTELGAKRLVLTSRRGLDHDGAKELLGALRGLGAEVEVLAADVADAASLAQVLSVAGARQDLPLTAVFHLAGVLDDGLLRNLDGARLETVLAPKLLGALNLHRLTEGQPLDTFVLFSSLVGFVGSPGQGNYAAANAGLDALAAHRRRRGLPGLSIAFGPWAEGGMVDGATDLRLRQAGLTPMSPKRALAGLRAALAGASSTVAVADVDWPKFRRAGGLAQEQLLAELVGREEKVAPAPALLDGALRQSLLGTPATQRHALLAKLIQEELAAVMAREDPELLDVHQGFKELGLDSLSAVALKGRLEARTGVPIPVTLVFDHPSVDDAARWLHRKLMPEWVGEALFVAPTQEGLRADEPIAIIGVGLRMPGGASDLDSLWEVLTSGEDVVRPIPKGRFDMAPFYDPDPKAAGRSYVQEAAVLDEVSSFDAAFFGISPREAAPMDPQHRLLLEASWAALEHAGLEARGLRGTPTGVFAGVGANEYERSRGRTVDEADAYYVTGSHTSFAAGRIAYHLGLEGPALTVDTACSSSLVALHLACSALRRGECDLALACGAQVLASPMAFVMLSKTQALAPDGRSKTFSDEADGYGRGEGVGVLVLKRLKDVRPGEARILGIVRGTAVNHDGASSGITAPNGSSQEKVLRAALRDAGVAPQDISVVECHGTGTKLGDPIEVLALSAVYGPGRDPSRPLEIGAVKSNLGHLESAAGVAGVLKLLAAFEHEALPPTLHSAPRNRHIPWADLPVRVTDTLTPWPRGQDPAPRRAAVSAFGLSGTNAHVILEEPPSEAPARREDGWIPLVVSAKTPEVLRAQAGRWAKWLRAHPAMSPADVLRTAAVGRSHFAERLALVQEDPRCWADALEAVASGRPLPSACFLGSSRGGLAMLFPGEGSQRPAMARDLYARFPVFRLALDEVTSALDRHLPSSLRPALLEEEAQAALEETAVAQSALFAMEVAMARLFEGWGVVPKVLFGHSLGELTAACVASVLSVDDAARLVVARSRLMQSAESDGARVSSAASEAFFQEVRSCDFVAPKIPIIRTCTGEVASAESWADPESWVQHLRSAIRFGDGLKPAKERLKVRTFLECGPGTALSALGMSAEEGPDRVTFIRALRNDRDGADSLALALAALYAEGHTVDWAAVLGPVARGAPVGLPTYPFVRQRHWLEVGTAKPPSVRSPAVHPLLGPGRKVPGTQVKVFASALGCDAPGWVKDHEVLGELLFPAAAMLELMLATTRGPARLEGVSIQAPLSIPRAGALSLEVTVDELGGEEGSKVKIFSAPDDGSGDPASTLHAEGRLSQRKSPAPEPERCLPPMGARALEVSAADFYVALAARGLRYGPAFQGLRRAFVLGKGEIWAELCLDEAGQAVAASYGLHPALLDAATHAIALAAQALELDPTEVFLPAGIDTVTRWRSGASEAWARVRLQAPAPGQLRATLTLFTPAGEPIAEVEGLTLRRATREMLRLAGGAQVEGMKFGVDWQQLTLEAAKVPEGLGATTGDLELLGALPVRDLEEALARGLKGCVVDWGAASDAQRLAEVGLAQLQQLTATPEFQLVWVTRGAMRCLPDDRVSGFAQGCLWGLARAARKERPGLQLTLIDVDGGKISKETWGAVLGPKAEVELALRRGEVWAPRLVRRGRDEVARSARIEGTVLVTGAFGALGSQVARWLVAERGVGHLLLLSQRGLEAPGAEALVEELRQRGAEVDVHAMDVADGEGLEAIFRGIPKAHPLRGVVHAAGVLDDGLLGSMSPSRLARVFGPKITGALHLHNLTRGMPLDLFVLFSSVAGVFGSAGQGSYAAANAFLDALAQHRRAHGEAGLSIAWGPWADGGMVGGLNDAQKTRLLGQGLEPLTAEQGLSLLDAGTRGKEALFVALGLDPKRFAESQKGAPPAMLQGLLPGRSEVDLRAAALRSRLAQLPKGERRRVLLEVVQEEIAQVLGLPSGRDVKPSEALMGLGIDSLSALEISSRLGELFELELSPTMVFDYPTAEALARWLHEQGTDEEAEATPNGEDGKDSDITARIAALSDADVGRELDALLEDFDE